MVQEIGPSLIQAIKGVAPFLSSIAEMIGLLAPPIVAIVTLLLQALAPAFKKFTEIANKFLAPFLTNLPKNFEDFKDRYCPDGQTCNDIATFGGLAFMVWFMYLAMEPILRF